MPAITAIGKYQVLATLGKGAHSTILQIRRQADAREYALKLVTIEDKEELKFLEQAKHEVRIAALLDHPNLIKVYCLETEKDWLFRIRKAMMLLEYVNGKTLDAVPVSQDRLVPVFAEIACGLQHMHRSNVFHADLKPNNVLYGKRGEVKIIDYGLAWLKGEQKGRIQGTPEYMAPETAKSKIVNERSDIYNLGATMYRITTLKLPPSTIGGEGTIRVNSRSFKQMLVPVGELNKAAPKRLADLIHRCLEYEAENRPARVGEVLDELKAIASERGAQLADHIE